MFVGKIVTMHEICMCKLFNWNAMCFFFLFCFLSFKRLASDAIEGLYFCIVAEKSIPCEYFDGGVFVIVAVGFLLHNDYALAFLALCTQNQKQFAKPTLLSKPPLLLLHLPIFIFLLLLFGIFSSYFLCFLLYCEWTHLQFKISQEKKIRIENETCMMHSFRQQIFRRSSAVDTYMAWIINIIIYGYDEPIVAPSGNSFFIYLRGQFQIAIFYFLFFFLFLICVWFFFAIAPNVIARHVFYCFIKRIIVSD